MARVMVGGGEASRNAIADGKEIEVVKLRNAGISSVVLSGDNKHDLNPSPLSHPPLLQTSNYPLPNSQPSAAAALH